MAFDTANLTQTWPQPVEARPVVIFGAGSIVADAHLPAYEMSNIPVAGIFDPDRSKREALCKKWNIQSLSTVDAALGIEEACFDLATPPAVHAEILQQLPTGSSVLLQKPMGTNLVSATDILQICRQRKLSAAVNFQLRFSPKMLALKSAIEQGLLGEIVDFDASMALHTPWHLWEFLLKLERVEISLHSIHYFDFVRSLLGNPLGVYAKTVGHPKSSVAQSRTSAILDYGDTRRCNLSINHDHYFGRKFQTSEFRICGTEGAAYVKLGVNLDYPAGEKDELWLHPAGESEWIQVPLIGNWFPHAFAGRMANLQRYCSGEDSVLIGNVEDAWQTMALIESAYASSARAAEPIAELPK